MVTGGSSRPQATAISLNSSRANEESPPRSKKLSSTSMEGCCSTRCQIVVSTSRIVVVDSSFMGSPDGNLRTRFCEPEQSRLAYHSTNNLQGLTSYLRTCALKNISDEDIDSRK